ncbi:hypothetical protein GCM10023163_23120 [Aestuariibaculum suncheonense]
MVKDNTFRFLSIVAFPEVGCALETKSPEKDASVDVISFISICSSEIVSESEEVEQPQIKNNNITKEKLKILIIKA